MSADPTIAERERQRVASCVIDAIAGFGTERSDVVPAASLAALDTDELDLLELSQIVEEQFGARIRARDAEVLETVGDVIDLVVARMA